MMQSSDSSDHEKRIISLEEGIMHIERLFANLNDVICQAQSRLDDQDRQLKALKETFERQKPQEIEERSFEDERPPHY